MRFACFITKTTDTHSEYVIVIAFSTATTVTRTRLNVTLHYIACLVILTPTDTLMSSTGVCHLAVLGSRAYCTFDDQLFLQPQPVLHREQSIPIIKTVSSPTDRSHRTKNAVTIAAMATRV